MPAYFSLTFELKKTHDAIGAFCRGLIHSGLTFKSGYWGFEKDSFEDMMKTLNLERRNTTHMIINNLCLIISTFQRSDYLL